MLAWCTMWYTHDSNLTILITGFLGYILPIYIYNKFGGDFSIENLISNELNEQQEKIKEGIFIGIGAAIILGILLSLWSIFLPEIFGPSSITLPFPNNDGIIKYIYVVLFCISFLIFGALEHHYFNYFTCIEFAEKGNLDASKGEDISLLSKLIISLGNALSHFPVFYFTTKPFSWAVIYTSSTFMLNLMSLSMRHKRKLIISLLFRVGVGLGFILYGLFLGFTLGGKVNRITPKYFFTGDVDNKWSIWFSNK